jgi:hypothetical protein
MNVTSNGLSIATYIRRLGMMSILVEERIAFFAQVEGTRGEILTASPISLQSWKISKERIAFYAQVEET